jgi:hypothetical protein
MRLGLCKIDNVRDFDAARFQEIGNKRAMTAPPNRFRAHDRSGPSLASKSEKALNNYMEFFGLNLIVLTAK